MYLLTLVLIADRRVWDSSHRRPSCFRKYTRTVCWSADNLKNVVSVAHNVATLFHNLA